MSILARISRDFKRRQRPEYFREHGVLGAKSLNATLIHHKHMINRGERARAVRNDNGNYAAQFIGQETLSTNSPPVLRGAGFLF